MVKSAIGDVAANRRRLAQSSFVSHPARYGPQGLTSRGSRRKTTANDENTKGTAPSLLPGPLGPSTNLRIGNGRHASKISDASRDPYFSVTVVCQFLPRIGLGAGLFLRRQFHLYISANGAMRCVSGNVTVYPCAPAVPLGAQHNPAPRVRSSCTRGFSCLRRIL
jgi:hypothetical protein